MGFTKVILNLFSYLQGFIFLYIKENYLTLTFRLLFKIIFVVLFLHIVVGFVLLYPIFVK